MLWLVFVYLFVPVFHPSRFSAVPKASVLSLRQQTPARAWRSPFPTLQPLTHLLHPCPLLRTSKAASCGRSVSQTGFLYYTVWQDPVIHFTRALAGCGYVRARCKGAGPVQRQGLLAGHTTHSLG